MKHLWKHDSIDNIRQKVNEAEVEQQKYFRDIEREARAKEEEALSTILKSKNRNIDKYYYELKELMKTLVNGNINGLLVLGEAGLGKTYQVNKMLQELGKKYGEDYAVLSSYATPLEFYQFLYHNSEKVIVLDDLLKLLDNDIAKGILLSALWSISPDTPRIVNYNSSTSKLDVPTQFEFKGKIIWCLNKIPNELAPLLSRIFKYEMKFTYSQKLNLIASLCSNIGIPDEVFNFIKENTDISTPNLNLRLPIIINELRNTTKSWKKIARKQIEQNPALMLVKDLQDLAISEKERASRFIEETGMSRRTYFRYRSKLFDTTTATA